MNIDKAYEYDILSRNVNYTLTKTIDGGFTAWELKESGSRVMQAKSPFSSHSLHKIRKYLLNSSEAQTLICLTTTQRNTLTNVFLGLQIFNSTASASQVWDGSSWV